MGQAKGHRLRGSFACAQRYLRPIGKTLPPVPVGHPVDNNVYKALRPRQCWLGRRCLEIAHSRTVVVQPVSFFPLRTRLTDLFVLGLVSLFLDLKLSLST